MSDKTPSHLPWGTYVEESERGFRVLFSDGKGQVRDVTNERTPRTPLRYFHVGAMVANPPSESS